MTDRFIPPKWLAEHRKTVVVVDVRRPWEYESGHVPGSVTIPFESFRDPTDATPGKLPSATDFGQVLGSAGIDRTDRIVAYDDEYGVYASRFLLTASLFGHDPARLHLLDGDYTAWADRYDCSRMPPEVSPTTYDCSLVDDEPLVTAAELDAARDAGAIIVDTRAPVEYDTVHISGAINLQWQTFVDEDRRRLKPVAECRELLGDRGITPDRPIRLYCNTARRLSFVYWMLTHLGYEDVAVYEGGIDAWTDYGGPVETS